MSRESASRGILEVATAVPTAFGTTVEVVAVNARGRSEGVLVSGRATARACTITGTPGPDVLVGTPGDDVICGLEGDDVIDGRGGDDVLRGGAGVDVLRFSGGGGPVSVNLTRGTATGRGSDSVAEVEVVVGTPFADVLTGNLDTVLLRGRAGDDQLSGARAVSGGAGDDVFPQSFGSLSEVIRGGQGTDEVDYGPGPAYFLDLAAGVLEASTGETTRLVSVENARRF